MLHIRKSLFGLVFFYVFLPLFLLLVWLNFQHFERLHEHGERALAGVRNQVATALETAIFGAGEVLRGLSDLPQSQSLLVLKSDALRGRRPMLPSTTPVVEAECRQRFQSTLDAFPALRNLALVDTEGRTMTALGQPVETPYAGQPWLRQVFVAGDPEPHFIGMHSNDTFTVITAVLDRTADRPSVVGAVVGEVGLGDLARRLDASRIPADYAAAITVPFKWHLLAEANIGGGNVEGTLGYLRNRNIPEGYWNGISFTSSPLSDALGMARPPQVLALYRGSLMPGVGNARMALGLGLSLVLLATATGLATLTARRIHRGTAELVDAGTWMLHQLRGQGEAASASLAQKPIYDQILRWQAGYKQSIADDIETYAFENKRDLFLARDFQLAYMARPFPPIPAMPLPGRLRLKFSHRYKPALAIGGDFFEVLNLSPETGGVFIADVMGHGTRSALITSILRVILADSKPQGGNARNFLREINRKFNEILETIHMEIPLFASAFYFVADCTARVATFSTAGHPAPFHLRRQSNLLETLKVSEPHGAALGITADEDYTGGSCRMMGGDVFIFFTDGAYECFNPRGEEFGIANLEKTIRRNLHRGGDEILQSILDALEDYSGGTILHDDICLLAVEIEEDLPSLSVATARGTHAGA
jgi:hypothetical protein